MYNTLEEIPKIGRANFERLVGVPTLPDDPRLLLLAGHRNTLKLGVRAAIVKSMRLAPPTLDALVYICVSSSHLQPTVDDFLKPRTGGVIEWLFPQFNHIPQTEWHSSPPLKILGRSTHLDHRLPVKDILQTICGLIAPDPPWRAAIAHSNGRIVVAMEDDPVQQWLTREGYVSVQL